MRNLSIALGAILVLAACGETTGPPGQGDLVVTVSTIGGDLDLDGYELEIDDRLAIPIGTQGQQTLAVDAGNHHLELHGIAANCSAGGDGPRRSAAVALGATVRVPYSVTCEVTGVRVGITSTGLDIDPNGFAVRVDDVPRGIVAPNGQISVSRLEPGEHRIALEDVAPNCQIQGEPSHLVTVVNREMAVVPFALECVATTGVIRVQVTTTGADPDDAYVAWRNVTAGSAQVVGGTGVLANVPAGTHQVTLADVGSNCAIEGQASQSATVTVGTLVRDTAEVAFAVTCVLDSGTIEVATTITGDNQGGQPTAELVQEYCGWYGCGYYSVLESALLAADGTAHFTPRTGEYLVRLVSGSSHCAPTDVTPPLQVTPGSEHQVHFDVFCGPPVVEGTVSTSGSMPDTEYTLSVWDYYYYYGNNLIAQEAIQANGTVSVELPYPGYFFVTLDDVADNCTTQAATATFFNVSYGRTANVEFTVTCTQ